MDQKPWLTAAYGWVDGAADERVAAAVTVSVQADVDGCGDWDGEGESEKREKGVGVHCGSLGGGRTGTDGDD
jgi:hypothetical protein